MPAFTLVKCRHHEDRYRPVSRILFPLRGGYHLSVPAVACGINLPTRQHRAGRSQALTYMAFQHARFTRK